MLVVQSHAYPAQVRYAITDMLADRVVAIKVAAAYTTVSGSKMLLDAVSRAVGETAFASIPKTLVTSFDYGITEPQALNQWLSFGNTTVRVAGAERIARGTTTPSKAFHPKIYAFQLDGEKSNVLVASANLTGRGFTVNVEAGWLQKDVPASEVDHAFAILSAATQPLSNSLLDEYRATRPAQQSLPEEAQPVAPLSISGDDDTPPFRDAVEAGQVDLANFDVMWVQVEALQGGSQNQLELPRSGHRFFGRSFAGYGATHNVTIGSPVLCTGSRVWDDRPLTWHGNNRMERLNLPTQAQGGPDYANSVVMFRRLQDGTFELATAPLNSDLAHAWTHASKEAGTLFRLGTQATTRLVGLIASRDSSETALLAPESI